MTDKDEKLASGLVTLGLRPDEEHHKADVQRALADKTREAYEPPPKDQLIVKLRTLK